MTKTRDLADLGGGFIQAGTGAVQRTVESKLQDVVSVKDFGAVGDGVADDTAAINAALVASSSVFFPPGTYKTTGNHNIQGKSLLGSSQYASVIQLAGSNTNSSVFVNGGSIGSAWGSGGGCVLQNLKVKGNWDGSTVNSSTNVSDIGALVKWWSGAYVQITSCDFSDSFGFGIFCYRLGYSYFNGCHAYTCGKNGIHLEAPSGSDSITSTSINYCSVHSCRGRSISASTGGNAIYVKNGFSVSIYGCVVEDVDDGFRLDGYDNRSVSLHYLHSEQCSNYDVYYAGTGLGFGLYNCVLGSPNKLYQSNQQYTQYSSIGCFGLEDTYELPVITNSGALNISTSTPSGIITSVTLTPGTWLITAAWTGTHAAGTGQASSDQAFAINTSAAIPGYSNPFDAAVVRGSLASNPNEYLPLQSSLSLIRAISSNTTFYLYGGPGSITGTLAGVISGQLRAVKINGPYI